MKTVSKKSKKAFTLMEMAIALTVTAVLMISICTLTVLIFRQYGRINDNSDEQFGIQIAQTLVRNWIDKFSFYEEGTEVSFVCTDKNRSLIAYVKTDNETVRAGSMAFDKDTKKLSLTSYGVSVQVRGINDVEFTIMDDKVIKMTMYRINNEVPFVILLTRQVYVAE